MNPLLLNILHIGPSIIIILRVHFVTNLPDKLIQPIKDILLGLFINFGFFFRIYENLQ